MGTKNKKQSTTNQHTPKNESVKRTVRYHLGELKGRLLWFVGSFIVAAIIGFEFKDVIQGLFTTQLADLDLVNLQPSDDVLSTFQISLFTGVLAVLPLGFYHAYKFMEPILNRGAAYVAKLVVSSIVLVVAALCFAFTMTIPLALDVMIRQGQDALVHHVSTQSFLNFAVPNVLAIVVLSQLPLVVIFAHSAHTLSKKKSAWLQRIVLPVTAITAWLATPSTTLNRTIAGILLIAVPVIIMFEVALFWARKHPGKALATQLHSAAVSVAIEQPAAPTYVEQPEQQLQSEPATFTYVSQKSIPETQQLDSFPDEMFDAMLRDKEEYNYDRDNIPSRAPLPSSLEVVEDELRSVVHEPQPAVQQQMARPITPVVMKQAVPPSRPQPVAATTAPAVPIRRPIAQPIAAPSPVPIVPHFTASLSSSQKPLPQPLMQPPQPLAKQPTYSRTITETLKPRQASTPPLRRVNAPQQTIPFRMSPARSYDNTIEGLLPA